MSLARRVAKRTLQFCLGVAVLYLVGMNVFLRTRLFRHLFNFKPEAQEIDYASAYSLYPGRIHVEGLMIRGSDSAVQWVLHADACDFSVSFLELTKRRFHASRIRGRGYDMRVRMKLPDLSPERLAALPPVPGFADPVRPDAVLPAELTDANYDLWTIYLDDADVEHVRELWIDTLRLSGDLHVNGSWYFKPIRWLEVGPATVDVAALDVGYGMKPLATGLVGSVRATVHPFDVRVPDGTEVLKYISVDASLHGQLLLASAFTAFSPTKDVKVDRGEGPIEARFMLDHGALVAGTHVAIEAPDTEAHAEGMSFDAAAKLELKVDAAATASLELSKLVVTRYAAEAGATAASIALTTHELSLAEHRFDDVTFAADVKGLEAKAIAAWKDVIPPSANLDLQAGSLRADAHLEGSIPAKQGHGQLAFKTHRLTVARGPDLRLTTDLDGVVMLVDGAMQPPHVDLSGTHVALVRSAFGVKRATVVVPSLTVKAPKAHLDPSGADGLVTLDLPRGEVADLSALSGLTGKDFDVAGGNAVLAMHFDANLKTRTFDGSAAVSAKGVDLRVGTAPLAGDLGVSVRAVSRGLDTDLSGTTVSFDGTHHASKEWWARVALRQATLRLKDVIRFKGNVGVSAKDASPATTLVSQSTPLPEWLVKAIPTDRVEGQGYVFAAESSLELRGFGVKGGGVSVLLEYADLLAGKDGAILVDYGPFAAGIDLSEKNSGIVLADADHWFKIKSEGMRARPSSW